MWTEIDNRFNAILNQFSENDIASQRINKAYKMAKRLHKDQLRKDGTPYLGHPVEVALILANLGLDDNVVIGALLHDVVEDCDCSLEQIEREFGKKVADYVDCVSAIDNAKFIFDNDDIYEDKNFEKASIEEQSFKKLIQIGKKNPLGFCIKFADRLHNLKTIETFVYSKQLEKVKETEKWIIPIANALNAEYFYRELKNNCFKIKHRFDGKDFFEHYEDYHISNLPHIEKMFEELNNVFYNSPIKTIKIRDVKEYKVFEDLQKILKNVNVNKVSQGQILKVTNYNIYLLYKAGTIKSKELIGEVLNTINKRMQNVKIIDAKIGNFTKKPYYQLEDEFKNKFNVYIESEVDYILQKNGTLDGQGTNLIDDDNLDSLEVELMRVKTRSNEIKFVQQNSTALDFAFKIHKDIGFGFKYAIINDSKTKSPPYTKLYEGDKVEIVVEKDENNKPVNNADLKWFAYINTDFAKKCLIKYFQSKINN